MTNITPRILSKLDDRLHLTAKHPLHHIKQRIVNFMYSRYKGNRGNPLFSVFDDLNPVVSVEQNFDELLVPPSHICRNKRDNYYINSQYLLRAHTSAHQVNNSKIICHCILLLCHHSFILNELSFPYKHHLGSVPEVSNPVSVPAHPFIISKFFASIIQNLK